QLLGAWGAGLVIWDNSEGLTDSARELLGHWREDCPKACWWLTSQERLGLPDEHPHVVQPLACPGRHTSPALARHAPAVRLIEALVRWRRGGFNPTERELEAMAELAQSLDGIPLALTMAAGRMALLDASTVLERLEDNLAFLRTPLQNEPSFNTHHTKLTRALAYAVDRLTAQERTVWTLCACFIDGFDVEAIEQIAEPYVEDTMMVLDTLEHLEQRFLLHRHGGSLRLTMLGALRHFAGAELKRKAMWTTVRDRHAAWFAERGFAFSLQASLNTASLDWLLRERLNLTAALEHTRQRSAQPDQDAALAALEQFVRLTAALRSAHLRSRIFAFPDDHLETALALARPHMDKLPSRLKGYFLVLVANARKTHNPKQALPLIDEALDYAQHAEDRFLEAALRGSRANHFIATGAFDKARNSLDLMLPLLDHPVARARTMMNLAVLHMNAGESHEAAPLLEEATQVFQDNAIHASLGTAHLNLSLVTTTLGRHAAALEHLEQSETLAAEQGNTWLQARTALQRLNLMAQLGRCRNLTPEELAQRIGAIQGLIAHSQDTKLTALLHHNIAQIHMEHEAYDRAIAHYTRALQADNKVHPLLAMSQVGLGLAHLLNVSSADAGEALEQAVATAGQANVLEAQRDAWLGLTLLYSVGLELNRAQACLDQARALKEDALLHLGEASIALGRARELDPSYAAPVCGPYLDEAVASLRLVFKPGSDTTHSIPTYRQNARMLL
ncbi:MAG: hypothetical protein AAFX99_30695, partial [Myxococcota bacterium]